MMCRNPLLPPGMALLCAVLCSVVSAEEKARPSSVEASFCQAALNFLRTKSTDVETRRAAASVVKALADEPRAPALVELLKNTDEEPNVRVSLTQALGRLKHKQAVPLFSELVTDPAQHRSLREAGLEGLVVAGRQHRAVLGVRSGDPAGQVRPCGYLLALQKVGIDPREVGSHAHTASGGSDQLAHAHHRTHPVEDAALLSLE